MMGPAETKCALCRAVSDGETLYYVGGPNGGSMCRECLDAIAPSVCRWQAEELEDQATMIYRAVGDGRGEREMHHD